MRSLALFTLTLAICGCETQPSLNEASNHATAEASGQRIANLSEGQRNAVFIRAIRDAGLECQQVTSSTRAEPYRGMPVWTASCRGGGNWTLVIGANEIVQVLNANEARLIRDPQRNRP